MRRNDLNERIAKIIGVIILFFELVGMLGDMISFFSELKDFSAFLSEISIFLSLICFCYIVVAIITLESPLQVILLYAVNLILINQLYDNRKWSDLLTALHGQDIKSILIIILAIGLVLFTFSKGKSIPRVEQQEQQPQQEQQTLQEQGVQECYFTTIPCGMFPRKIYFPEVP